jgi:hypothetical protein
VIPLTEQSWKFGKLKMIHFYLAVDLRGEHSKQIKEKTVCFSLLIKKEKFLYILEATVF